MPLIRKYLFKNKEFAFFILLVLVTLLPVLSTKYFITLDGPSHLYNANLIKELLLGNHRLLNDLFSFKPVPVPNWSGHFIMAFFNLIFPAYISEKILLVSFLTLTPFFFRRIVLFFAPANKWTTYLIFPFLHNHLLYFGFFNMSLGIMFMFITISYFLSKGGKWNFKSYSGLTLLLLPVYFSHIVLFFITLAVLILSAFTFIDVRKEKDRYRICNMRECRDRILLIITAAFPWIVLAFLYFLKIDSIEKQPRTDLRALLKWIVDVRPLLTVCYCDHLIVFTRILLGLLIILIFAGAYFTFRRNTQINKEGISFQISMPAPSLIFAFFALSFLFLYLLLPNAIMISDRLILLFYIFLVTWLAMLKYPRWLQITSLVIILVVHLRFVAMHTSSMRITSKNVEKIEELAAIIPEGNMVMALNYCDHWLYSHSTGYIGANRALAVLENYETAISWFPLRWNHQRFDTNPMSNYIYSNKDLAFSYFIHKQDTTVFSMQQVNKRLYPIKYLFEIGSIENFNDPCALKTKEVIKASYKLIGENDFCKLYQLKR